MGFGTQIDEKLEDESRRMMKELEAFYKSNTDRNLSIVQKGALEMNMFGNTRATFEGMIKKIKSQNEEAINNPMVRKLTQTFSGGMANKLYSGEQNVDRVLNKIVEDTHKTKIDTQVNRFGETDFRGKASLGKPSAR